MRSQIAPQMRLSILRLLLLFFLLSYSSSIDTSPAKQHEEHNYRQNNLRSRVLTKFSNPVTVENKQTSDAHDHNNSEKCGRLSFIHPTKSGGTAIEKFLSEYYSDQIDVQVGHKRTSRDVDCSLIVVRNPYDRAWSMFQYWKYGSDIFTRTPEFLAENEHVTFEWFLDRVQFNPDRVYGDFLWDVHFLPTSHWLDSSDYHNTVAMEYHTDMNDSLQELFRKNDIIDKGVVLRTVNPTSGKAGHQWTSNERLRVERIFASDFYLLNMMQNKPELFNQVIRR